MSFFNPKEDVIEIQLTSYGKHLLSQGKFKPAFYSFLDDEIIYDSTFADTIESQNNTQTRIKDSIRTKCQSLFTGVETNIKKVNKMIRSNEITMQESERIYDSLDNSYAFPASIGNYDINSQYSPAWNVKFLNGNITGSVDYITGSYQLLKIPRINTFIEYESEIKFSNQKDDLENNNLRPEDDINNKKYNDGSYIFVGEDFILLDVSEKNSIFSKENFDIEIFEMKEIRDTKISGSWTELIPLSFVKKNKDIPPEMRALDDEIDLNNSYIEYYYDFLVDEEIDKTIFCEAMRNNKERKDLFVDNVPFECDEAQGEVNLFDLPEDGVEECD